MKFILTLFIIILLSSCNKQKTVLICGDHICLNKVEAKKYFEENLTLEVKIIENNKKNNNEIDLIELNLNENDKGKKQITMLKKKESTKKLNKLSKKERKKIKKSLKEKNTKKKIKNSEKKQTKKILKKANFEKDVNKKTKKEVDVCAFVKKCNIDEISKFLIKEAKNKKFPDITKRQE